MSRQPVSVSLEILSFVFGTASARPKHMAKETPNLIPRAQKYATAAFAFFERFPFPSKGSHAARQFAPHLGRIAWNRTS
jgi:hypothetical protein